MNRSKSVTLYNVLFPIWMILLFPQMWLIVLPGNFLIDSLVLLASMAFLKMSEKKLFYKKHIFAVFSFGILSDIAGSALLFLLCFVLELGHMGDELYLTLPAILLSAAMIFMLNYYITFKKVDRKTRLTLSIIFSVVTAPYTFLIPTSWLY